MTAPWSTAARPTFSHPRPPAAPTPPQHPLLDPLPGCTDRCRAVQVLLLLLLPRAPIVTAQLTVDLAAGRVTIGEHTGRPQPTATEWRILAYLTERVGQLCLADEILTAVWGAEYRGDRHLLRVNLSRLRAALGCAGGLIEMRMGLGWRLRAEAPCACEPGCAGVYGTNARGGNVEARVLDVLRAATEPPIGTEIGAAIGLSGGSASDAIARLRRRGYEITARPGPQGGYCLIGEPS